MIIVFHENEPFTNTILKCQTRATGQKQCHCTTCDYHTGDELPLKKR